MADSWRLDIEPPLDGWVTVRLTAFAVALEFEASSISLQTAVSADEEAATWMRPFSAATVERLGERLRDRSS